MLFEGEVDDSVLDLLLKNFTVKVGNPDKKCTTMTKKLLDIIWSII
jgi:hypothetical protein